MSHSAKASLNALPIPTRYGQETFMDPKEIALAIVFLASEKACGINGIVMFVDGGTDALLNTEKVYKKGDSDRSCQLKNISMRLKIKIMKDWETFLPKTATTATTVPTADPSMTTIYMEKKPSPCFSGTNFSAASIPFWNRRC